VAKLDWQDSYYCEAYAFDGWREIAAYDRDSEALEREWEGVRI
jgi:hypothetical protein